MTTRDRSAWPYPILALVAGVAGTVGVAEVAPAQQAGRCARICVAQPDSANPSPRYPEILRSSNVQGSVALRVVVDTTGRVMHGESRILRSRHELFTQAVRSALPHWRYLPARQGSRLVRDTLEYEVVFRWPDAPGLEEARLPALAPTAMPARTGTRRWRIDVGWPSPDSAATPLDSATVATVSEAVLATLLDRVLASPGPSTQPRVACIRRSTEGRVADMTAETLARLARPGVLVLAWPRCPPTFTSMIRSVDPTGRSTLPPGEDPHWLGITRLRPWRDGLVLVEGDVAQGTGRMHYTCMAQRTVADAGAWQIACGAGPYEVSLAPSGRYGVASRAR